MSNTQKNSKEEIMLISEYHQRNLMMFHVKDLKTTDTALCTLTSIDRMSFLANGIEHHECNRSELTPHFTEVIKRNLIMAFFDKIEIEPFDALDVQTSINFLFE